MENVHSISRASKIQNQHRKTKSIIQKKSGDLQDNFLSAKNITETEAQIMIEKRGISAWEVNACWFKPSDLNDRIDAIYTAMGGLAVLVVDSVSSKQPIHDKEQLNQALIELIHKAREVNEKLGAYYSYIKAHIDNAVSV